MSAKTARNAGLRGMGWLLALAVLGTACARSPAGVPPSPAVRLKLATTTSTENSGLLAELLPPFERSSGIRVDVIAVGTGKALRLGRSGDVDAVLVHARESENAFVAEGYGVNRRDVMHNDFILLGPPADPAGIRGGRDAASALLALAQKEALFVSRGDDSGTHRKEQRLWREAGVTPAWEGYLETGQGMGASLVVADEKRAYCLADRGTFLAFRGKIELTVLVEGDPDLHNPYGIIAVNPALHPGVKYREAMRLIAWVTSPEGAEVIGSFRLGGEVLFHPAGSGREK